MAEGLIAAGESGGFGRRHGFLLILLWAQIPVIAAAGLAVGQSTYDVTLVSLALIACALSGMAIQRPRLAGLTVALGLVATSGALIHYAGGAEFAHFHLLITICAISFYKDAAVLTLGVLMVALYHLIGMLVGGETLAWAIAHTSAVSAFAVLMAIGWRVTGQSTPTDPSGDRFRMSFEEAPIGMAVLKPSGQFLEANRAMAHLLGCDQRSLTGTNITAVVHVDDQDELGAAWEMMGNSPGHSAVEWMRCMTADGHPLWSRFSLSLVPRTDHHPALVILQVEDADRAHEEQRHMQTLIAGKDEFVAAVAGEMRRPLGQLIDLTDAAERANGDSGETLPRIEAHAREVASIMDDLIVSARAGTSPTSVVSHRLEAESLCREVVAVIAGAGDVVRFDFRAGEMWGDPTLTRQIVNNLVGNAVRYGGPSVTVRTISSGPDTVIQVFDNGPELPSVERERVFSGDLRNGSPVTRPAAVGLSLTVSRHLARQMEGDVVYRRTPDGENLFELRLPSEQFSEVPRRRGVLGGTISV